MLARPTIWDPQYRDLSGSELLRQVDRDTMLYDLTNTNKNNSNNYDYEINNNFNKNYYKNNVDDFIRDDEIEHKPKSRKQEIKTIYAELRYTQDVLRGKLHSEISMWLFIAHLGLLLLLAIECNALEKITFTTSALIFGASVILSILYTQIRKSMITNRIQKIDGELADLRNELHQINAKNRKTKEAKREKKLQKAREEFIDNQINIL